MNSVAPVVTQAMAQQASVTNAQDRLFEEAGLKPEFGRNDTHVLLPKDFDFLLSRGLKILLALMVTTMLALGFNFVFLALALLFVSLAAVQVFVAALWAKEIRLARFASPQVMSYSAVLTLLLALLCVGMQVYYLVAH
jgi:hypothetical protein